MHEHVVIRTEKDMILFIAITWKSEKKLTYITEGIDSTFFLATDVQLDNEKVNTLLWYS